MYQTKMCSNNVCVYSSTMSCTADVSNIVAPKLACGTTSVPYCRPRNDSNNQSVVVVAKEAMQSRERSLCNIGALSF